MAQKSGAATPSSSKRAKKSARGASTKKAKAARKGGRKNLAKPIRTQSKNPPGGETGRPLKVRATRPGYYKLARIRVGNVFTLDKASHYSEKWMEWVDPETPERITTSQAEIDRQHDEIRGQRESTEGRGHRFSEGGPMSGVASESAPTGDEDVLLGGR